MFTEAIERVVIKRYIRGVNLQELFSYLNGLKLTWKLIDEIIENLKTSLDMGFVLWYPLGTLKDKVE